MLAAALAALPSLPAEEPAPPAKARSAAAKARKDGAKPEKEAEKAPPLTVKLPPAGRHDAEAVLALAGVLTGRTVHIEGERARRTKVEISDALAEAEVTLPELTVLLAAHRLYLFPITDPKEGKILVVSSSPTWSTEPQMFTLVVDVPQGAFDAVVQRVEKAVEERNARLPKGLPPFVAVSSARVGKVFLRGPREPDLHEIARAAEAGEKEAKEREVRRPRLYTYQGRFRKVEDHEVEVLDELGGGGGDVLRTVISSQGNRLLYRCPAALAEKVKTLLEKLDKPAKAKQ
jgi:hypothetical protein